MEEEQEALTIFVTEERLLGKPHRELHYYCGCSVRPEYAKLKGRWQYWVQAFTKGLKCRNSDGHSFAAQAVSCHPLTGILMLRSKTIWQLQSKDTP